MRIITLITSIILILSGGSNAAEHYVRPAGTCTNTELQFPYASWDNAATNIQRAVDAASFLETVWVTNGSYCVTSQVMITNNIILKSVNGYSKTLVYADYPNYTTRVFYVARTGVVDGFTISNGHNATALGGGGAHVTTNAMIRNCYVVNNVSTNWANGGGIWVGGGSLSTVSNCLVVSNQIFHGRGGGIYLSEGYVLGCTILSNRADGAYSGYYNWNGGGIHQDGGLISNCYFAFNYALGMGAGIRGYLRVVDCVISNNTAGTRGGGISEQSASGYVKDCIVVNNRSMLGGGLEFQHGNNSVTNCVISGNSASQGGGGVFVEMNYPNPASTYLSLDSCLISNNLALSHNGGGGITIAAGGAVLVRNCLIANNTNKSSNGYNGGGIALVSSSNHPTRLSGIINCTIANNWTTNEGGGIAYTAVGTNLIPVINCIIAGNWSSSGNYHNVYNRGDSSNNYSNCCANAALPPSQGNITNEPLFVGGGDWRLTVNSPCINSGINQDWMINSLDLGGGKRVRYNFVDMGAYEGIFEATIYTFR